MPRVIGSMCQGNLCCYQAFVEGSPAIWRRHGTLGRAELRQKTSAPATGVDADLGCCRLSGGATLIDLTACPTLLRTEASGPSVANSGVMPER